GEWLGEPAPVFKPIQHEGLHALRLAVAEAAAPPVEMRLRLVGAQAAVAVLVADRDDLDLRFRGEVQDEAALAVAERVEALLDALAEADILADQHVLDVVDETALEPARLARGEVEVPALARGLGAGRHDAEH